MKSGHLHQFVAYQNALDLFDLVVADVARYLGDRKLERLASQQLASADSVCANIEEGYGLESTVEYRRFPSREDHCVKRKAVIIACGTGYHLMLSNSASGLPKKSIAS